MSSRNTLLSSDELQNASEIYKSLLFIKNEGLKLIIVPHEIDENFISKMLIDLKEHHFTIKRLNDIKNNDNFTLAIISNDADFANTDTTNVDDISIDFNTVRGTSLVTASHTADWFSMIRLDNATITPSSYPFNEGDEAIIPTPNSGYRPLDATQKDNFIFFSCLGSLECGCSEVA